VFQLSLDDALGQVRPRSCLRRFLRFKCPDTCDVHLLHVRNDHANLQFRINGVLLPDGVTGFGSIFDTSFIGTIALVTGALPAEYGLRTTGLVDIIGAMICVLRQSNIFDVS
jgi:hypothetical protein